MIYIYYRAKHRHKMLYHGHYGIYCAGICTPWMIFAYLLDIFTRSRGSRSNKTARHCVVAFWMCFLSQQSESTESLHFLAANFSVEQTSLLLDARNSGAAKNQPLGICLFTFLLSRGAQVDEECWLLEGLDWWIG